MIAGVGEVRSTPDSVFVREVYLVCCRLSVALEGIHASGRKLICVALRFG